MTDSVDRWLTEHALWHDAIVIVVTLVVTVVFAPFITRILSTLNKFVRIPPQRLNVWILKTRISVADAQLQEVRRLREDQSYLIAKCFFILIFMLVFATTMISFLIFAFGSLGLRTVIHRLSSPPASSIGSQPELLLLFIAGMLYCTIATFWFQGIDILFVIKDGDEKEQMYETKLERLKTKLLLRDNKHHSKSDSDA